MAGDHDLEACCFRLQIEFRQVVQHVNGDAANLDSTGLRQFARPGILVDVAADGADGRDGCEFLQNLRRPDISGVDDSLRALQSSERFRTKQSMSVGNDADEDGISQFRFSVLSSTCVHEFVQVSVGWRTVQRGISAGRLQLRGQPSKQAERGSHRT